MGEQAGIRDQENDQHAIKIALTNIANLCIFTQESVPPVLCNSLMDARNTLHPGSITLVSLSLLDIKSFSVLLGEAAFRKTESYYQQIASFSGQESCV